MTGAVWGIMLSFKDLSKMSLLITFILCPLFVCGLGNNVISRGVWQGVGTLREGKDHFTPLFRALSGMGFKIAGEEGVLSNPNLQTYFSHKKYEKKLMKF